MLIDVVWVDRDAAVDLVAGELQRVKQARALAAPNAWDNVELLVALLRIIHDGPPRDVLNQCLADFEASKQVPSPPSKLEHKLYPEASSWRAVFEMTLNTSMTPVSLGKRQQGFAIPDDIANYYSCTSSTSSRFRQGITKECMLIIAAYIVDRVRATRASLASPSPMPRSRVEALKAIRSGIRRVIAQHGLADPEWSAALSSQYFLCLLAKQLDLTARADYAQLLNRFLGTFTYRVDDSVDLNEEHVLVTPEELLRMSDAMAREDANDPYFAGAWKTRSENVDVRGLHLNYLYGLTVGIAAGQPNSQIINTLLDVALEHLTSPIQAQSALDTDGGWQPYRIAWITGRILLSLTQIRDRVVNDGNLLSIVREALSSLEARATTSHLWRSGVGDWVSEWEATGLCLEALIAWSDIFDVDESVNQAAEELLSRQSEWLVEPDLTSDTNANATLAAVILCCCLTELDSMHPGEGLDADRNLAYLNYLGKVLALAERTLNPSARQYCTIPQILYYCSRVLPEAAGVAS